MRFDQFWQCLQRGGKTPEGDKYRIVKDDNGEKLHILSPRNANNKYYITLSTTKKYFDLLKSGKIEPKQFRKSFAYFHNVYREVFTNFKSAGNMQ